MFLPVPSFWGGELLGLLGAATGGAESLADGAALFSCGFAAGGDFTFFGAGDAAGAASCGVTTGAAVGDFTPFTDAAGAAPDALPSGVAAGDLAPIAGAAAGAAVAGSALRMGNSI